MFSALRASPPARCAISSSTSAGTSASSSAAPRRTTARSVSARVRLELVDLRPREQRRVDLEVRVLGRRADQRQQAVLDAGQQRILLRLVEAVDLVEEEDRPPAARAEPFARLLRAPARTFATVAETAESSSNSAPVVCATIRASVVFPEPGGPNRISDGTRSCSIARRSARPGPTTCSWPTKSSSVVGRSRWASGAEDCRRLPAASLKRSLTPEVCSRRWRRSDERGLERRQLRADRRSLRARAGSPHEHCSRRAPTSACSTSQPAPARSRSAPLAPERR